MAGLARQERSALCDTFSVVGPDAPTLCEGWTTKDLAAHLIIRERRPDAAVGGLVPMLRERTQRITSQITGQDWAQTVSTLRSGPPRWSPFSVSRIDEMANVAEFFIHHEDVRRAGDDHAPRSVPVELQQALWASLPRTASLVLRKVRVGVVAEAPGIGRRSIRSAKSDHGSVVIAGAPAEILLFIYGRGSVAQVSLDGADRDVEALRTANLGL